MHTEGVLPIAEVFESIQGEGTWVGTPMLFVRLAGCNVGKPAKALKTGPFPVLYSGREAMACCTFDGRIFPCDTDYTLTAKMPIHIVMEILERSGLRHVCVTGGEPFLHADLLEELFEEVNKHEIQLHVETSGTIKPAAIWQRLICPGYWITCAPKLGALSEMITRADEIKLLVDKNFDVHKLTPEMREHRNVFLCPINSVDMRGGNDDQNVQRCRELLKTFTNWRLSLQIHKEYGWR